MGKPKYEMPTRTFPYKISRRLCILSVPRPYIIQTDEGMPAFSPTGVRMSALKGQASDRVHDVAYPFMRNLLLTRRMWKDRFSKERLEKLEHRIEVANTNCYTKYANAIVDLRKLLGVGENILKDKKKKGWSESDWKKHMDYISVIANPRPDFPPPPLMRGEKRPLAELISHANDLARLPDSKMYRRASQENWYKDPIKVRKSALTYKISDRVKQLAAPRVYPQTN